MTPAAEIIRDGELYRSGARRAGKPFGDTQIVISSTADL
jgi:hypothetical protein